MVTITRNGLGINARILKKNWKDFRVTIFALKNEPSTNN